MTILKFVKLTDNAYIPLRGSKNCAGLDLRSAYDYTIKPCDRVLVATDLMIQLPMGTYGRIAPRSSLALRHGIDVGAGVIDEDYRGNIYVLLFNHGKDEFRIKKGDKIAQLVCEKIAYPLVEEVHNLSSTDRGAEGFGSTGI